MRALSLIKRHLRYSQREKVDVLLSSFIFSLVIFMFVWRITDFELASGLGEWFIILIATVIVMLLMVTTGKIIAILNTYTAEYSRWTVGLLSGFGMTFISVGWVPVFFPGILEFERIKRLSIGAIFPGENRKDIFKMLSGTLWVIMVSGLLFQLIYRQSGFDIFRYLMYSCALIAIYSVLPFVKNFGSYLFFTARRKYYYVVVMSIVFGFLLLLNSILALLIAALLSLVVGTLLLRNPLEQKS